MITKFNFYLVTRETGDGKEMHTRVVRAPIGHEWTSPLAKVWSAKAQWLRDTRENESKHRKYPTRATARAAMARLSESATGDTRIVRALKAALRSPGVWTTDQHTGRTYGDLIHSALNAMGVQTR